MPIIKNKKIKELEIANPTSSTSSIVAATIASIPTFTGTTSIDNNSQATYDDESVFLIIGLIVGVTIIGCILACLYRRRRIQKFMMNRSLRNTSVGSKIVMHKTDEKRSPGTINITDHFKEDIEIDDGPQEEPSNISLFSNMKLPPTTALPPIPTEAQLPHSRSTSLTKADINDSMRVKSVKRTKSLDQTINGLPKFNYPPLPRHALTPPASFRIRNATNASSTSISSLNGNNVIFVPPPPTRLRDADDLLPSPTSSSTTSRKSSENHSQKPSQTSTTYESNINNDKNGKATRKRNEDTNYTIDRNHFVSLPKVETINKNLSINFEQLSIFKDEVTLNKVNTNGVGERDDLNNGVNKLSKLGDNNTTKEGDKNVEVLVINNGTGKLYNEYI
ncbi:16576_t:CDS:1 [Acaulospora morrowiae]|uniref:16576_t:CDS:1 n=1 Tax=Acaulospora morrowiae TaxID=94023 RepID=A0A9N8ZAT8_9GLOM|nr:16576_t:CDS:1 [Acaulospora morrowiae]